MCGYIYEGWMLKEGEGRVECVRVKGRVWENEYA